MSASGFYKLESSNLIYAPNFVRNAEYDLFRENKDSYTYPVYGWYWFDSELEAKEFFGIPLDSQEQRELSLIKLKNKIQEPQYAVLSDEQLLAELNDLRVDVNVAFSVKDVEAYAIKRGFWALIDIGQDDADINKKILCRNVMAWIKSMKTIDVQDPDAQTMIDALLYFELITQENKQDILAMGNKNMRWADHVQLNIVNNQDLAEARVL